MHYFDHQDKVMNEFSRAMREHGAFLCGDLTVNESDNEGFLETLERTVSKTHAGHCKPSEARGLLETYGFQVLSMNTFTYQKLNNH